MEHTETAAISVLFPSSRVTRRPTANGSCRELTGRRGLERNWCFSGADSGDIIILMLFCSRIVVWKCTDEDEYVGSTSIELEIFSFVDKHYCFKVFNSRNEPGNEPVTPWFPWWSDVLGRDVHWSQEEKVLFKLHQRLFTEHWRLNFTNTVGGKLFIWRMNLFHLFLKSWY